MNTAYSSVVLPLNRTTNGLGSADEDGIKSLEKKHKKQT